MLRGYKLAQTVYFSDHNTIAIHTTWVICTARTDGRQTCDLLGITTVGNFNFRETKASYRLLQVNLQMSVHALAILRIDLGQLAVYIAQSATGSKQGVTRWHMLYKLTCVSMNDIITMVYQCQILVTIT